MAKLLHVKRAERKTKKKGKDGITSNWLRTEQTTTRWEPGRQNPGLIRSPNDFLHLSFIFQNMKLKECQYEESVIFWVFASY
jgi:hypothetical protein